jgi:AraC-like DNA-binding protein
MKPTPANQSVQHPAVARPLATRAARVHTLQDLTAAELLSFQKASHLLKQQITACTLRWFQGISGLPLHAFWHEPLEFHHSGNVPLICPTARCQRKGTNIVPPLCQLCSKCRWASAVMKAARLECFTGHCGSANCCAVLTWENTRPLTLVLQARVPPNGRPTRESNADAAFQRAVSLLRLLHHDLHTTLQNHSLQDELALARMRLQYFETADTRKRKERHRRIRESSATPASHAAQLVQVMLDYTRQHYCRPMALRDVAAHLGLNANYLSDLFHKTTGMTFHHYLDDLRLEKAEELLRDPRARVCEVARAVGYASPNHFRNMFKAHKSLTPSVWREIPL